MESTLAYFFLVLLTERVGRSTKKNIAHCINYKGAKNTRKPSSLWIGCASFEQKSF